MNILFVHLLNNYTGSPKVLANILNELSSRKEFFISLLTSKTEGCLSGIPKITYYNNYYKWTDNKCILLFRFIFSQIYMFFFIFFIKNVDIVYINSILPFSAALAAKLRHKKIIYHVHEVYIYPNILQQMMCIIMEKTADKIITVSKYVSEHISHESVVIYNTVSRDFEFKAKKIMMGSNIIDFKFYQKIILMVSSLKKYKGIGMFVSLAKQIPDYSFFLVLSSSNKNIEKYFLHTQLPNNIKLIPEQINLIPYYFNASVVVNLSIPDSYIETFGMTLIEGFELGTPCIAPDSGGPKEIVESGKNGILVNTTDETVIIEAIKYILSSRKRYAEFAKNVFALRKRFSAESGIKCLIREINSV